MKKLTVAILILFATSLFGAAFASACMSMAAPRAGAVSAQEQMLPCCALKTACAGGSCFASKHNAGCPADHGVTAVGQKSQAASDLVKAPVSAIIPSPRPIEITSVGIARPPSRISVSISIAGYADICARTGRLLI